MSDIMNRLGGQRNTAVIDVPSDWQTTGVVQSAGEFSSKNRQRPFFQLHVYPHYLFEYYNCRRPIYRFVFDYL